MMTPAYGHGREPGMAGQLSKAMRKVFHPIATAQDEDRAFAAQIASLCERIERVGEDRGAAPFRPSASELCR